MQIDFAPAAAGDVPALLALIRELAEYENLADRVHATENSLRRDLFGSRAFAEVILARRDGVPVGYAVFFQSYSTFLARPGLYLEDLFVQPAARGVGIGKALFREVARIAAERRCGRLEFAVLDWNEPAIDFYKALGAVPLDDWTTYRMSSAEIEKVAASPLPLKTPPQG